MEHDSVSGLRKTSQAEILEEDQDEEKEVKNMKENWYSLGAKEALKEILDVAKEVYPDDPMPEKAAIHAALVAGKDEVIKALRDGTIQP